MSQTRAAREKGVDVPKAPTTVKNDSIGINTPACAQQRQNLKVTRLNPHPIYTATKTPNLRATRIMTPRARQVAAILRGLDNPRSSKIRKRKARAYREQNNLNGVLAKHAFTIRHRRRKHGGKRRTIIGKTYLYEDNPESQQLEHDGYGDIRSGDGGLEEEEEEDEEGLYEEIEFNSE